MTEGPLARAFLADAHATYPGVDGSAGDKATQQVSSTPLAVLLAQASKQDSKQPKVQLSANASSSTPSIAVKRALPTPTATKEQLVSQQSLLTRSLRSLLASQPVTCSLQRLYTISEHLVEAGRHSDLYDAVKIELERAAGEVAKQLRAGSSNDEMMDAEAPKTGMDVQQLQGSVSWLARLDTAWKGWSDKASLVRDILLPLDRTLKASQGGVLGIFDLALDLFKERVIDDAELHERTMNAIVYAVNLDRDTPNVSYRKLHRSLVQMLLRLASYEELERRLHHATTSFYTSESAVIISNKSMADYLAHATRRIEEEHERAACFYSSETGQDVNIRTVREELVKRHVDTLVTGLPKLLEAKDVTALAQLYSLCASTASLAPLRAAFASFIRTTGEALVDGGGGTGGDKEKDKVQDDTMIDRLLEFKAGIDTVVREAFASDGDILNTQKDGFEAFINKRGNRVAELIAKFLDVKLRSGNKIMTDAELERCLDEALVLFRYTHDKDMFEEFYKRFFAKRLLLNRSASSDAEQSMLLKLKAECGPQFTAKLETMLKDIAVSEDVMKAYSTWHDKMVQDGAAATESIDVHVNVLTQAQWPTYPHVEVIIPADMASAAQRFTDFYSSRNSGRRLTWAHTLGHCSVVGRLAKAGEKELHVSLFQAIVLLLFNDAAETRLGYGQIRERVGLEDKELKRTLQSLACGRIETRVLRKEPQGRDVHETDHFVVNENLKNERKRIRINQIQMTQTAEEAKDTREKVVFERELVLQAAAVRVLKARKQLKHAELLNLVVDAIKERFSVDVGEIKKVFEVLIDKEYMERVEGERGVYRYLA